MMKLQVLKCWRLVLHATKNFIIPISLLFLVVLCVSGQNGVANDKDYYKIIEKVAYEDTIVHPGAMANLQNGIKKGKYTKEDSLKYISVIKNKKPAIFKITDNLTLKKVLNEELVRSDSKVVEYLTKDGIMKLIRNITEEQILINKFSNDIILLEKNSNQYGHFFSSAVLLDNYKYVIYHYNHNNSMGGNAELLVIEMKEGSYEILNRIFLWAS